MADEFNQVAFESKIDSAANSETTTEPEQPAGSTGIKPIKMEQTMPKKDIKMSTATMSIITVAVVLAGVVTGYGVVKATNQSSNQNASSPENRVTAEAGNVEVGKVYGEQEPEDSWDKIEGVLVDGGLEGEGSHHILRPGGPTQTVYVTSSFLDLDPFIGHKVEAEGETYAAQKAAWLMDVGHIKVLELNAEPPFAEDAAQESTKEVEE